MSPNPTPSRIPQATNSPRPIPTPQLNNLSLLSESSTGSWERGRMHGNARSPPTHPSLLADSLASGAGPQPATQKAWPANRGLSSPNPATGRQNFPLAQAPNYQRQAREGYGFRPTSGQTTPTHTGQGAAQFPFTAVNPASGGSHSNGASPQQPRSSSAAPAPAPVASSSRTRRTAERDDDDMDHMPDGQTVEELRKGVRAELEKNGLIEAAKGVVQETGGISGIADEDGLGWPGASGSPWCSWLEYETCS